MLKPGSKVIVKAWSYWTEDDNKLIDWLNDSPEYKARVVSVGEPSARGNINISFYSYTDNRRVTSLEEGFLFHPSELLEIVE